MSVAESLPQFLFPGTNSAERRWLAELKRAKKIRAIGPRLHTSLPPAKTAAAVRSGWMTIVSHLYPEALISHRTALEFKPSSQGDVYLTAGTHRTVAYPGLRLRFLRGPKPLTDDPPFLRLHSSSLARALLENLSGARAGATSRVSAEAIEERLLQLLEIEGEPKVGLLRDRARQISEELGWHASFARLDGMIGALLGTRAAELRSARATAYTSGKPFDPACLRRLQLLFAELRTRPLPVLVESRLTPEHVRNKAFFEAYFSNFIEGTTFEIEEAEQIVFDRRIPEARPKDGHDIMGTFRLASDPEEMRRTPRGVEELVNLLCARHQIQMGQRSESNPGRFKDRPNRAGDTHFVAPNQVVGTLQKGHELYTELPAGLARAIFMLFLISEVHPFLDGNGRIARVMMNAELVASGLATIIIPTVFRDDYLLALRALTRRERPTPIIQALVLAQRCSALDFTAYPTILRELERRSWFREPDEARLLP